MNFKRFNESIKKAGRKQIRESLMKLECVDKESVFISLREKLCSELTARCEVIRNERSAHINPEIELDHPILGRSTTLFELLNYHYLSVHSTLLSGFIQKANVIYTRKFQVNQSSKILAMAIVMLF